MSPTLFCALLACGLAVLLARETRIRRALQDLVVRLLDRLKTPAGTQAGHRYEPDHHPYPSRNRR